MKRPVGLWMLLMGLAAAGCGRDDPRRNREDPAGAAKSGRPVVLLIAASTKDAVAELTKAFTAETGAEVRISADDSSKLAKQIADGGAPADLFLSANQKWADYVAGKGHSAGSAPLLGNSLVLIVPKGNPAGVKSPADLAGAAVKRVAVAGPTVPAGIYAKAALSHLKQWNGLSEAKKLAPGENVRTVLTYVDRGEAEAGIVYATDARISDKVEVAYTFPADSHEKIVYPLVLTKAGADNPSARKLYEYLQSLAAAEVFKRHGFTRLGG